MPAEQPFHLSERQRLTARFARDFFLASGGLRFARLRLRWVHHREARVR